MAPLLIAVLVAVFYALPIASPDASIHWDAADVHYPLQRYFAERIPTGIPAWTPYLLSGYPILANPETEAWYPPNWPFYALGFRPRSIEWELALHAFLACLGAYLLFSRLGVRSSAAMLGAMAYGFSGYFAGHSAHVPVFLSAAWLPWLLWACRRAVDGPLLPNIAGGALAGGAMILAGYYQVAILAFLAMLVFAVADAGRDRRLRWRAIAAAIGIVAGAAALSAIQLLPSAEFLANSIANAPNASQGIRWQSLATLLFPDASGTFSHADQGLITDHYLYAGVFLLPLALVGAVKGRTRIAIAVLAGSALWYMLGPGAGLYRLGARLSGNLMAGPPDLAWFIAALALAWLAAQGSEVLSRRRPLAGLLLAALLFADVWYWNLLRNPLAYEHASFDAAYGRAEQLAGRVLAAPQLPLTRFDSPAPPAGGGPLLAPLDLKLETTYGYFVRQPRAYAEYRETMARNAKLRDGLNVSRFLNPATHLLESNPAGLARAYFPASVADVASDAASRKALERLNPSAQSIVLGPHPIIRQDPDATPFVAAVDEQSYRIHYTASSPSLLKLAMAWYPGWRAAVDGRAAPVLRVDHALMGVVVPPGEHMVELRFVSTWFRAGLAVSLIVLFGLSAMALRLHSYLWTRIRMKMV